MELKALETIRTSVNCDRSYFCLKESWVTQKISNWLVQMKKKYILWRQIQLDEVFNWLLKLPS